MDKHINFRDEGSAVDLHILRSTPDAICRLFQAYQIGGNFFDRFARN